MGTTKDYQRYAVRCLQEARTATDSQHRFFLVEMAQAWRSSLNMRPLMEIRPIVRLPNWIEATKAASFGELFVLAARYL